MSMEGNWFLLGSQLRQSMEDFGIKGRPGGGLRWLVLKVGEPIRGAELRVVMTPHNPSLTTWGLRSGSCQGISYKSTGKK